MPGEEGDHGLPPALQDLKSPVQHEGKANIWGPACGRRGSLWRRGGLRHRHRVGCPPHDRRHQENEHQSPVGRPMSHKRPFSLLLPALDIGAAFLRTVFCRGRPCIIDQPLAEL